MINESKKKGFNQTLHIDHRGQTKKAIRNERLTKVII